MRIFNSVFEIQSVLKNSVVTIGNFDGMHLGHREIISRVIERARHSGGTSVLMTFYPHPRKVLFPELKLKSIFPKEDLEQELRTMGLDVLIYEPFSRELSQMSPDNFITERIVKPLSPQALIVGYDFAFGANREGTLEKLKHITDKMKINLEVIGPIKSDNLVTSSSQIRSALANGQVDLAEKMLGRPFYLKGLVEKAEGRGRKIGFPTANLLTQTESYPKTGVYATITLVRGKKFFSVTNIGFNPTFTDEKSHIKVETHILGFDDNIYGEEISVYFKYFIRDEKKFKNVQELTDQIRLDIEASKALRF